MVPSVKFENLEISRTIYMQYAPPSLCGFGFGIAFRFIETEECPVVPGFQTPLLYNCVK